MPKEHEAINVEQDSGLILSAPQITFDLNTNLETQVGEERFEHQPDFVGALNSPAIPTTVIARISSEPRMPKVSLTWNWPNPGFTLINVRHTASIVYDDHNRNDRSQTLNQNIASLNVTYDFGASILGGTFSASCIVHWRRNKDGVQGDSNAGHFSSSIRADNPSKSTIRGRLTEIPLQVIAYMESRFIQFDNTGLPLFGPPRGFGIMQLDTPPPSATDIWDWGSNVSKGISLHQAKKGEVARHFANIYAANPKAPKLSQEMMSQALYQYYNGGFYWDWDAASKAWKPVGVTAYGDNGLRIEKLVRAGSPPADWG